MHMSLRLKLQILVSSVIAFTTFGFIIFASEKLLTEKTASLMDSAAETARYTALKYEVGLKTLEAQEDAGGALKGSDQACSGEDSGVVNFDKDTRSIQIARSSSSGCRLRSWAVDAIDVATNQNDEGRLSFLIDNTGSVLQIFGPPNGDLSSALAKIKLQHSPIARKVKVADSEYVVSMVPVAGSTFWMTSAYPTSLALRSVWELKQRSILIGVIMISLSGIISLMFGRLLTNRLMVLTLETKRIAQGDLDIHIASRSSDEVGSLADSIETMARDLKKYLSDSIVKARMEDELKTARLVQDNLFPKQPLTGSNVLIEGFSLSASECGGDFWYRWEAGGSSYFILADATGHGVPAALITSAARAVVAMIQYLDLRDVAQMVTLFNEAVLNCSRGSIMMTALVGEITATGDLRLANCSHESPLILNRSTGVTRPLSTKRVARLGERALSAEQVYLSHYQLGADEVIFCYTDGLSEAQNAAGQMYGVRALSKVAQSTLFNDSASQAQRLSLVTDVVKAFADNQVADDMTMVTISRQMTA